MEYDAAFLSKICVQENEMKKERNGQTRPDDVSGRPPLGRFLKGGGCSRGEDGAVAPSTAGTD